MSFMGSGTLCVAHCASEVRERILLGFWVLATGSGLSASATGNGLWALGSATGDELWPTATGNGNLEAALLKHEGRQREATLGGNLQRQPATKILR